MTIPDPARVSALIARLNAARAAGRTWRSIAQDYPKVAPGTLCRIAGGEWLPKSKKILRALGLAEKRAKPAEFRSVTEARCEDCDQIWSGRGAHKDGREHAMECRHRVRVTQMTMRVYEVER